MKSIEITPDALALQHIFQTLFVPGRDAEVRRGWRRRMQRLSNASLNFVVSTGGVRQPSTRRDRNAADGLLLALKGVAKEQLNPLEQALWMLFADFFAAAVPILPFVFLPIGRARIVSGVVTVALLIGLGIGRAQLGSRNAIRTVAETVSMGVGAAIAGVAIGVLIDHSFS
jgi:VIT1/CCC1 family predicted Fe2+/Mn2+ transporter